MQHSQRHRIIFQIFLKFFNKSPSFFQSYISLYFGNFMTTNRPGAAPQPGPDAAERLACASATRSAPAAGELSAAAASISTTAAA
jgi:hypothetical protein